MYFVLFHGTVSSNAAHALVDATPSCASGRWPAARCMLDAGRWTLHGGPASHPGTHYVALAAHEYMLQCTR